MDNNLSGTLKLLQKELKAILDNNSLSASDRIKCNIKTIDKKNFQVICSQLDDSE